MSTICQLTICKELHSGALEIIVENGDNKLVYAPFVIYSPFYRGAYDRKSRTSEMLLMIRWKRSQNWENTKRPALKWKDSSMLFSLIYFLRTEPQITWIVIHIDIWHVFATDLTLVSVWYSVGPFPPRKPRQGRDEAVHLDSLIVTNVSSLNSSADLHLNHLNSFPMDLYKLSHGKW